MPMKLAKYLANLGYGSRREVERMIDEGRVTDARGNRLREGDQFVHDDLRFDDDPIDVPQGTLIMLNKPRGYVCSTNDVPPLVYDLLPERFLSRSPVMATVGRLDRDTSGLLLLTDDGALNHRLTSPRSHVPKTYVAQLASPISDPEIELLSGGTIVLEGESKAIAPAVVRRVDDSTVHVTVHEGRYHQVRRMFAAVGNHVNALERVAIGKLALNDLQPGSWRVVSEGERALLNQQEVPAAGA